MPFCHNDTSKKYTGNEKSPLGLGYTALVEPVNKIQIGKDNNYYIVKQYNNNLKRWKKINDFSILFNDLPKEYFTDAYKPITKSITKETGLEEKFGGEIPFFIKGEKWPSKNEYNMTFFCQFKDPRKKDNILYRVFINIDEPYGICDDYWINKIELSPQNTKKQIKVLDIFSGSGCIGVALLKNIKNVEVTFADNDKNAILQIKKNLKINSRHIRTIIKSDVFKNLKIIYLIILNR